MITILKSAEKKYYADRLQHVKESASETWKVLNEMTNRNGAKKPINQIQSNDVLISDKQLIADKFIDLVVNIGPELAKAIPPGTRKVNEFLTGDFQQSMFLRRRQNRKCKTLSLI